LEIVLGSEVSDDLICWNLEFSARHDIIVEDLVCQLFNVVILDAVVVTVDLVSF
jgi:hypothetical protein